MLAPSMPYSTPSNYINNLLDSLQSEDAAIILARELREMLKCGGFRLCKFISCPAVLASLPAEDISPSASLKIDDEGENIERALRKESLVGHQA